MRFFFTLLFVGCFWGSTVSAVAQDNMVADSQKVNQWVQSALQSLDRGDISNTRRYLNEAQQLADSTGFLYGRQQVLHGFGEYYLVQQKFDSAEIVLQHAMDLHPEPPLSLKTLNLLATAHRYQGDNQQAIKLYLQAFESVDTTKQTRLAAGLSQNLADAYMNLGFSGKAFKNYHKAISYGERSRDSLFLATALNNVGNAYNSEEKYEEAAYYLERSLKISEAIEFKPGELRALLNLGITRSSQSHFAEAESLYLQALSISEQVRPDTPPIQIQYNLGELYNRMEKWQEAENYFRESLKNSRERQLTQGIYYNSTGLGNVAEGQGNIADAIKWQTNALQVARSLKNPGLEQETHHKLYSLYKRNENYRQALAHLESSKALTDSLNSKERDEILAEYQTRLEVERKDQENRALAAESSQQQAQLELQYGLMGVGLFVIVLIAIFTMLLYKSNKEKNSVNRLLEAQKKELEEKNEVQNKLFGVVAHDLRTPLSALIGMLDLIRSQTLSKEEMQSLVAELELSLQQNVNIMENLLVWAKQQMSGLSMEREAINAKEVADEILASHKFNAEHKRIVIKNRLSEDLGVYADYNMLKLVLRNLVSNSIKFSEEEDEIVINATTQNGEVLFEVRDTGIGIPEDIQPDIFGDQIQSRKGTQRERGSGMGLRLCKEFIEKQGGHIYFESEEGKGTAFYFSLPMPKG